VDVEVVYSISQIEWFFVGLFLSVC
jgi:hypothetical protein